MRDLEQLLGFSVDVTEPAALHRYIKERVLMEAVDLNE